MPFVRGYLNIVSSGHPDQGLPEGEGPVDPGYGRPGWSPVDPGYGRPDWAWGRPTPPIVLPPPPPGIWPPPTAENPIQPVPPRPPTIGGGPALPPGMIWPPPGYVTGGPIYPGGHPGGGPMPVPPPTVGGGPAQPPPQVGGGPVIPPSTYVVLAWISGGIGWKYIVVDPSLTPTPPMQPTPEPKR